MPTLPKFFAQYNFSPTVFFMLLRCIILSVSIPFLLLGCTPFAPDPRTTESVLPATMPSQYGALLTEKTPPASRVATAASPWWKDFHSQDLDNLINKSLNANFDILTAWATLRQSEAITRKATAGLFPTIDLDSSATQKRVSTQATENSPQYDAVSESFNVGFAASYELDLWGRVMSTRQAEILRTEATAEDLQSAAITVAASVADTWVALLGNRAELAVLREQIDINKELVRLQTVRFNNGLSTSLTVLQQKELLASLEAEIPPLEQAAVVWRNNLAVLQGTLPSTGMAIDENMPLPTLEAMPDPGLPIQILDARPDIRAAWARLTAGDWDVSAAHANRYPALRISASQVYESPETSLLLTNWVTALIGSLTMPLFDGGALAAEEEQTRAQTEALVHTYAKTVATVLQEVDNALAADQGELKTLHRLEEQLVFAKAALIEARNSYLGGVVDFLNYITELENVQKLERSIAVQRTTVVRARITLYRTLGGLTFPNIRKTIYNSRTVK